MNCHATLAVLDLHAEGRLTPSRTKAVAAHLASCSDCRTQSPVVARPAQGPVGDFKARLAVSLKAERRATGPHSATKAGLSLWPRDLSAVAVAAAALALFAVITGWSGAPSQQFDKGDELAAGRTP